MNYSLFLFFIPQSPEPSGNIDLRSYHVTEGNYTKRKHVFKLTSAIVPQHSPTLNSGRGGDISTSPTGNGTEILIQTESQQDMKLWMENLRTACGGNDAVRSQVCWIELNEFWDFFESIILSLIYF